MRCSKLSFYYNSLRWPIYIFSLVDITKLDASLVILVTRLIWKRAGEVKERMGNDWGWGMDIVTTGYKFQHVNLIMFFYINN